LAKSFASNGESRERANTPLSARSVSSPSSSSKSSLASPNGLRSNEQQLAVKQKGSSKSKEMMVTKSCGANKLNKRQRLMEASISPVSGANKQFKYQNEASKCVGVEESASSISASSISLGVSTLRRLFPNTKANYLEKVLYACNGDLMLASQQLNAEQQQHKLNVLSSAASNSAHNSHMHNSNGQSLNTHVIHSNGNGSGSNSIGLCPTNGGGSGGGGGASSPPLSSASSSASSTSPGSHLISPTLLGNTAAAAAAAAAALNLAEMKCYQSSATGLINHFNSSSNGGITSGSSQGGNGFLNHQLASSNLNHLIHQNYHGGQVHSQANHYPAPHQHQHSYMLVNNQNMLQSGLSSPTQASSQSASYMNKSSAFSPMLMSCASSSQQQQQQQHTHHHHHQHQQQHISQASHGSQDQATVAAAAAAAAAAAIQLNSNLALAAAASSPFGAFNRIHGLNTLSSLSNSGSTGGSNTGTVSSNQTLNGSANEIYNPFHSFPYFSLSSAAQQLVAAQQQLASAANPSSSSSSSSSSSTSPSPSPNQFKSTSLAANTGVASNSATFSMQKSSFILNRSTSPPCSSENFNTSLSLDSNSSQVNINGLSSSSPSSSSSSLTSNKSNQNKSPPSSPNSSLLLSSSPGAQHSSSSGYSSTNGKQNSSTLCSASTNGSRLK
jgi:hypothetical protein